MVKFVVLVNWTDQGIRSAKDTLQRAHAFSEMAQSMGGKVTSINWTIGPHDIVATLDMPDDETATRLSLMMGMQGNARTLTMRAFDEGGMKKILSGM